MERSSSSVAAASLSASEATLMRVLLQYVYWLFAFMFPENPVVNSASSGGDSERDVEMGIPTMDGARQLVQNQALAEESGNVEVAVAHQGGEDRTHQTMPTETSGSDPARDVTREHDFLSNLQSIGVQVVGIWNVPTVIGVIGCLIQVKVEDPKAKSNHRLLLNLCFGASLVALFLGLVLFIFSIMPWNSPRKSLINKFLVIVALGSAFVDLCLLSTFGFIVTQSNTP